jgi:hypothetical protein
MSTPTIALPREFRRLSGPAAANLGAVILIGLSALAAVFCAQVAYHQFFRTFATIFQASGIIAEPPEWIAPLLVDLSGVSSLLCTFVALCIAAGAARLVFWPEAVSRSGRFPFPNSYRGFFTMFGLMGTLVGFTISFSPLDAATIEQDPFAQSQMLLAGLATALYSTLIAIILAYGFCPLVEGMFRGLRRMRTGDRAVEMSTAIECLSRQAGRAAATLAGLDASASKATERLDMRTLTSRVDDLQAAVDSTAAQLAGIAKQIEFDRDAATETSADAAKTFADVMERLRALDDGVARVTDAVQRTTESSKALEKRFDGFLGVLRQIPS